MNIFVVIPGFNEGKRIRDVIEKTKRYSQNIIVVDDGSTDTTYEEAEASGVHVLKHIINLGKGAALKTGSAYAIEKGADALIYMDSDGQHKPEDIPTLINALEGKDIVFTYRDIKSKDMPLTKKVGNLGLNFILKALFHIHVNDSQSGYKILTTKTYKQMNLASNDYLIESEMVAKTGKLHLRFTQIPIHTVYQDKYKGTTVIDGVGIGLRMLWWKISK